MLVDNLTSPALLFFVLGIIAVRVKSDLSIPQSSSHFISLYLLFSIGFKGGQELSHTKFGADIFWPILAGMVMAALVPLYSFLILRTKLNTFNSAAIAAAYGSVSAVTFVTAASFLEIQNVEFGGHMVAVMALMEAPAILIGVILVKACTKNGSAKDIKKTVGHSFTNGSVFLILGSLLIGFLASEQQAQGIKPFTTDIFKGFLAIFLLDMGISSGKKLNDFLKSGWFTTSFAILMPIANGCLMAIASHLFMDSVGDRFMLTILVASASYIAVPAAMKKTVPQANPGLYLPMALAITFPINITIGLPLYYALIQTF